MINFLAFLENWFLSTNYWLKKMLSHPLIEFVNSEKGHMATDIKKAEIIQLTGEYQASILFQSNIFLGQELLLRCRLTCKKYYCIVRTFLLLPSSL